MTRRCCCSCNRRSSSRDDSSQFDGLFFPSRIVVIIVAFVVVASSFRCVFSGDAADVASAEAASFRSDVTADKFFELDKPEEDFFNDEEDAEGGERRCWDLDVIVVEEVEAASKTQLSPMSDVVVDEAVGEDAKVCDLSEEFFRVLEALLDGGDDEENDDACCFFVGVAEPEETTTSSSSSVSSVNLIEFEDR